MLFNCLNCGKTISSKLNSCAYCKTDTSAFAKEFTQQKEYGNLTEKHSGTFFAHIFKLKAKTK